MNTFSRILLAVAVAIVLAIAVVAVVMFVMVVTEPDVYAVTNIFPDHAAVTKAGTIERDWLPPLLPMSATNIVDEHDLDSNRGEGSFNYDVKERDAYIERLKSELHATHGSKPDTFVTSDDRSVWLILLPAGTGLGTYRLSPVYDD